MTSSFFIAWLLVMLPIVISPSPINITFATSGVKYGFKGSLPLIFGVDIIFVLKSTIVGFVLSSLLENNSYITDFMQIAGIFYLFYLSYSFFLPSRKYIENDEVKLSFFDGVITQFFNLKGWMSICLMFSLFGTYKFFDSNGMTILTLVIMLSILNISAHLIWISFSSYIVKRFIKNDFFPNIVFSLSLFFVAVWFLFDSKLLKGLIS